MHTSEEKKRPSLAEEKNRAVLPGRTTESIAKAIIACGCWADRAAHSSHVFGQTMFGGLEAFHDFLVWLLPLQLQTKHPHLFIISPCQLHQSCAVPSSEIWISPKTQYMTLKIIERYTANICQTPTAIIPNCLVSWWGCSSGLLVPRSCPSHKPGFHTLGPKCIAQATLPRSEMALLWYQVDMGGEGSGSNEIYILGNSLYTWSCSTAPKSIKSHFCLHDFWSASLSGEVFCLCRGMKKTLSEDVGMYI